MICVTTWFNTTWLRWVNCAGICATLCDIISENTDVTIKVPFRRAPLTCIQHFLLLHFPFFWGFIVKPILYFVITHILQICKSRVLLHFVVLMLSCVRTFHTIKLFLLFVLGEIWAILRNNRYPQIWKSRVCYALLCWLCFINNLSVQLTHTRQGWVTGTEVIPQWP